MEQLKQFTIMEPKSEVKKYVKKKRKYFKVKAKKGFFKSDKTIKYVAINPITYKVVGIFNGISEVEYATNRRNLQPLMLKHVKNKLSKTGSPLLCGWIFTKFVDGEIDDMSMEELEEAILKRSIDKIIIAQLQRIRENLDSFTQKDKQKMFRFLNNCESPNPMDINIKIKL